MDNKETVMLYKREEVEANDGERDRDFIMTRDKILSKSISLAGKKRSASFVESYSLQVHPK